MWLLIVRTITGLYYVNPKQWRTSENDSSHRNLLEEDIPSLDIEALGVQDAYHIGQGPSWDEAYPECPYH